MELIIYLDETEFQKGNEKYIGCGFLCLEKAINVNVINDALNKLKKDPDIHEPQSRKQDNRTIQRNYFHASDDSQNAHSHLCESIRNKVNGDFYYCYYKPDNTNSSPNESKAGDIQNLTLLLSSISISNLMPNRITFIIEKRSSFSQSHANNWVAELYNMKERNICEHPMIPSLFPQIDIILKDKNENGLQVTDFILWSINRTKMIPENLTWFKRLNLKFCHSMNEMNGLIESGKYCLKQEIKRPIFIYPVNVLPKQKEVSNEELLNSYILIETKLKYHMSNMLPRHVDHLKSDLSETVDKLKNKNLQFSTELIQQSASIFLRLFDTLPLYKNFSKNDYDIWKNLLIAKKIAALIIRNDLPYGVDTMDYITKFRQELMKTNFSILGEFH